MRDETGSIIGVWKKFLEDECMEGIFNNEGVVIENRKDMLNEVKGFYEELYKEKKRNGCNVNEVLNGIVKSVKEDDSSLHLGRGRGGAVPKAHRKLKKPMRMAELRIVCRRIGGKKHPSLSDVRMCVMICKNESVVACMLKYAAGMSLRRYGLHVIDRMKPVCFNIPWFYKKIDVCIRRKCQWRHVITMKISVLNNVDSAGWLAAFSMLKRLRASLHLDEEEVGGTVPKAHRKLKKPRQMAEEKRKRVGLYTVQKEILEGLLKVPREWLFCIQDFPTRGVYDVMLMEQEQIPLVVHMYNSFVSDEEITAFLSKYCSTVAKPVKLVNCFGVFKWNYFGEGHTTAECKERRKCDLCGAESHMARTCPTVQKDLFGVDFGAGGTVSGDKVSGKKQAAQMKIAFIPTFGTQLRFREEYEEIHAKIMAEHLAKKRQVEWRWKLLLL
ncbi:hypothetical protein XELAEV_180196641mg [Pelobates cultripes]|uniref:Zinc finger CCHC domain-containing protein n=1 Tax=Pelobates cultripes TaxID=61616 RepID=A0AAD1TMQ6_PELCU|nr:hypothetical protein XELAEV_180196641mg [Pelobates cultripes]